MNYRVKANGISIADFGVKKNCHSGNPESCQNLNTTESPCGQVQTVYLSARAYVGRWAFLEIMLGVRFRLRYTGTSGKQRQLNLADIA